MQEHVEYWEDTALQEAVREMLDALLSAWVMWRWKDSDRNRFNFEGMQHGVWLGLGALNRVHDAGLNLRLAPHCLAVLLAEHARKMDPMPTYGSALTETWLHDLRDAVLGELAPR